MAAGLLGMPHFSGKWESIWRMPIRNCSWQHALCLFLLERYRLIPLMAHFSGSRLSFFRFRFSIAALHSLSTSFSLPFQNIFDHTSRMRNFFTCLNVEGLNSSDLSLWLRGMLIFGVALLKVHWRDIENLGIYICMYVYILMLQILFFIVLCL